MDTIRDPQTGIVYEVLWRKSGKLLETPVDPKALWRGSTAEQCALYGGNARTTKRAQSATEDHA